MQPDSKALSRQWRSKLSASRAALFDAYQKNRDSNKLLGEHSKLIDLLLQQIWQSTALANDAALIAVGGYGRGEIFPYSDIDILILLPSAKIITVDNAVIESFISLLWDIGLEVGHSVRDEAGCIQLAAEDISIATNLLEQRYIAGDQQLQIQLEQKLTQQRDIFTFVERKLLEKQQRHLRYFGVANNLEPNIKEAPGGLRDLHTLLWISQAIGLGNSPAELTKCKILSKTEQRQLERNILQLKTLRVDLHLLARRHEERLIFDFQQQLAKLWGFRDTQSKMASEQLMQMYFKAARTILQLAEIILPNLLAHFYSPLPHQVERIDENFCSVNSYLELNQASLFEQQPSAIFSAFLLLQRRADLLGFAPGLLQSLWRARTKIDLDFRREALNQAAFIKIFHQPRLTRTLRLMNLYGVLGKYLPAFGRIVGRMQHDLFHVYSVDEHILMVVRNLRRLTHAEFNHEQPFLSRLMSDFAKPELLYIAALFHDIAKGCGSDHSQAGMKYAQKFCTEHRFSQDDADTIVWLVGQHITMSIITQRQDIDDPQVIEKFAKLVGTPQRLTALYLLTFADIHATGPTVWNDWKASLLKNLYQSTINALQHGGQDLASTLDQRKKQALKQLIADGVSEEAIQALWKNLDTVYFLRHDVTEIIWHTKALHNLKSTEQSSVCSRNANGSIQVLVYTPDQARLFARICSFFSRINCSIVDARIYTTHHGYALDTFSILAQNDFEISYSIENGLLKCLNDSSMPVLPYGRISRRLRHLPIQPQVVLRPDDDANYYLLSFVAGDRPNMLAQVAHLLADYQISVHSAKIMTLGERVEDSFLLKGENLKSEKQRLELEQELLKIFNA